MPEIEELEWIILLNKILDKGNPRYSKGMETVTREAFCLSVSLSLSHTHTPLWTKERSSLARMMGKKKKKESWKGVYEMLQKGALHSLRNNAFLGQQECWNS